MGKARILIVEDEWLTSDHLRRLLTRLGYEVVGTAASGASALEQLEERNPDLLLADIGLAGEIDGVEVAARAREEYGIAVIFLTALSDPETIGRARITEPYGFLVKPFAEEELHATVEIALQQNALRKKHAEEAIATTNVLARTQEELKALSARLVRVQEEERAEIARDLHDDLGQQLSLIQIAIEGLWHELPAEFRKRHKGELARVLRDVEKVSKHLRDVSHRLHPSILEDLGIVAALRALAEAFGERYSRPTRLVTRNLPNEFSPEVSLALYRITQEALHNVAKHTGKDATIMITFVGRLAELELTIRDTGLGIERERLKSLRGLGLMSMAQRAELIGGALAIDSVPGQGTSIRVRVPLESRGEASEENAGSNITPQSPHV